MNATQTGLLAGLILGIAAIIGGFAAFVIALALGIVGLAIGRFADGDMELSDLFGRSKDR